MAMDDRTALQISMEEERFERFDPSHGTPDPMVRRRLTIRIAEKVARFEQTDYGHPGRFNPWDPRGVDPPLQPRMQELQNLCQAISAVL
jgi:hypothetical protein